jgi:hypothetical protein
MDLTNCFYLEKDNRNTKELFFNISLLAAFYIIDLAYTEGCFGSRLEDNPEALRNRDAFVEEILRIAQDTGKSANTKETELRNALGSILRYNPKTGNIEKKDDDVPGINKIYVLYCDENKQYSLIALMIAYLNHKKTISEIYKPSMFLSRHLNDNNIFYQLYNLFYYLYQRNPETDLEVYCLPFNRLPYRLEQKLETKPFSYFEHSPGIYTGSVISQCLNSLKDRLRIPQAIIQIRIDRRKKLKTIILIALALTFALIGGFGLFMRLTNFIIFNAVKIVAPLITTVFLLATTICIIILVLVRIQSNCCKKISPEISALEDEKSQTDILTPEATTPNFQRNQD